MNVDRDLELENDTCATNANPLDYLASIRHVFSFTVQIACGGA